ncbi:sigma-70 family RNA polymerase sigma factor [Sediminibacterium sp.]|uniref:RNA polymerase sigma factor n=1 Tax=Sediminibacterium sp. TaxID=1917865 RepID=UPI0025EC4395|nr:sigma-70 family RNA polymerase sigma factor [Sediminibacterium sp.]MBW0177795.1 sigma-70 family RNA polymerase sigma factor [Sediminibacterium sp.]
MTEAGCDIELLVRDCIANKRKAQETLYRELYAFAMQIALRYSRDEFDAADILSNAFVKIFKYIHHFDPQKGSLHGWVKKIIVNEGLDQVKSRQRFSENVELETVEEPLIDNRALQKMGADELMELIRKLPPATHAVFVLYAVDGYTHREIAEQLQISEGTSKWHLSEARKKLQQALLKT